MSAGIRSFSTWNDEAGFVTVSFYPADPGEPVILRLAPGDARKFFRAGYWVTFRPWWMRRPAEILDD